MKVTLRTLTLSAGPEGIKPAGTPVEVSVEDARIMLAAKTHVCTNAKHLAAIEGKPEPETAEVPEEEVAAEPEPQRQVKPQPQRRKSKK